jgi:hypothetical protein
MKPEIRQRILKICAEFGEDMDSPACERLRQHAQSSPDCAAFLDSVQKTIKLFKAYRQPISDEARQKLLQTVIPED